MCLPDKPNQSKQIKPGVLAHTCNLNTPEVKAEGLPRVQGHPGLWYGTHKVDK